nr:zinc finger BED domain-containing protein RICESLEEPER 2-like [Coffea arabica]
MKDHLIRTFVWTARDNQDPDKFVFSRKDSRKALARSLICDEQTPSDVQREKFRIFMSLACPSFRIPSCSTVNRDCYELFEEEKTKLKSILCNKRVSLSVDAWTSEQETTYLCVKAHFLDSKWKLQKNVLEFCPISDHSAGAIGKAVEKCLLDWGIDKIFAITVEDSQSNDVAIHNLKTRFSNSENSLLGGKYLHLRYIDNVIKIMASDSLQEIGESVARIREMVHSIVLSPARLIKFKECVELEKIGNKRMLCMDVPTNWISTFFMLDTAQKLQKAFEKFQESDPHCKSETRGAGMPNRDDWQKVEWFIQILRHLYGLTLHLSCSRHVTTNTIFARLFEVHHLLSEWQDSTEMGISSMARRLREKYTNYWGKYKEMNLVIYLALILDPRYKLEILESLPSELHLTPEMGEIAREAAFTLFDEYKRLYVPEKSSSSEKEPESGARSFPSDFKKYLIQKRREEALAAFADGKSDLERYLDEPTEQDWDYFDVLGWWKGNNHRFPILSNMAHDLLVVPVSRAALESKFSRAGYIRDSFSGKGSKMLQVLLSTKSWLLPSHSSSCVEDDVQNLEEAERI